jgi:DUF1680 family protein
LAASKDYPYDLRWSGGRQAYISKSNCCPPNTVRTIAEVSDYMYSVNDDGLYINMYGGNTLSTKLKDGSAIKLEQTTNYPWDGKIIITVKELSSKSAKIYLRIPVGAKYHLKIKGLISKCDKKMVIICRKHGSGDKIELILDMPATLIESNPLVEETRNQVASKRGRLFIVLESSDLPQEMFLM